jgi:hypothetical protein
MPVASSAFTLETAQADGSRWCREVHQVTGGGDPIAVYWLARADADCAAIMAARIPSLDALLAEQEAADNIERDGALTFVHITGAQMVARFREEVRGATRERACYLAWWLIRRIAAGHITDTQARNAFGMTSTQWTTFKAAKLQPRHDAWAAVIAATGE